VTADAFELTAEQAWFVADAVDAGTFPWVLAITPPWADDAARLGATARLSAELSAIGVLTACGEVHPVVRQCIIATCRAQRWLDLRFVSRAGHMLRGHIARCGGHTVVALRSGGLITFSALVVDHPHSLVPILTAGLSARAPATFDEFTLPMRIGARADERLRSGADLDEVLDHLLLAPSARDVVAAAYRDDRSYVEIVAGDHRDGRRFTTDVGVSIVDTSVGRVLVYPAKAFDGEWVSTFTPGTPSAIAIATERLTATLPGGAWFPQVRLTRDFENRTEDLWHRDQTSQALQLR
jgi:hypothetical protein